MFYKTNQNNQNKNDEPKIRNLVQII